MKKNCIEINKMKDKKKYLDEAYAIMYHYKQLIQHPRRRIIPYVRECLYLVIAVILYVLVMFILFKDLFVFNCFLAGFSLFAVIIYLKNIIVVYKQISIKNKKESDSILTIDEEKVELKNNVDHISYECYWKDIYCVLISNYCISFLPCKKDDRKVLIVIPIDYKDECFELLEKYKKMDFIINNR